MNNDEQIIQAWRGQSQLHHITSLNQRQAGNEQEANRLANAGNLAALVADELSQGKQADQTIAAYQRRLNNQ